jgi:TolB-like protein
MRDGEATEKSSGAESEPPDLLASPGTSHAVFLSYASHDAEVAKSVCEHLEKNGIRCWIAPRDVPAGALYADSIVRAINEAQALVVVLSQSAVASSHVGKEIERSSSKKKKIIAFRIDPAPLTPALEYFLSESQWIDVPALEMPAALTKLANAVGQGSSAQPRPVSDAKSDQHAGKRTKRVAVVTAVAVIGVGGAVALGVHFWSSNHSLAQAPSAVAITDKSIAVLPFADMSEKHDQEYFADGMAEEIIDLLVKVPDLKVIGRTSSFQFKGKNEDLRTIGSKLNAAYVLEGSVRKSGDQVRITAQLINARSGTHEWSETYDRHMEDLLKLQDAIAAAVARELQLTVSPGDLKSRATTRNAEAYDLYLRGRHAADRWDEEGFAEAVSLYHQALDLDPTFVEAMTWLAWAYTFQGEVGFLPPATAFEQAQRAAATAIQLDPKSAEAHNILGEIAVYEWDWATADRELHLAAMASPGSAYIAISQSLLSLALGRWDNALRRIEAAQAQDPLEPSSFIIRSWIQERRGHLVEAESAVRRALEIRPNYGEAHFFLGTYLLARGKPDAALLEMQQETRDEAKREGLAMVYYALGKKSDSDSLLADMLKEQAADGAFNIARVYASRGQADDAMHWLERAYAQKAPHLFSLRGNPLFKNLESDPRYKALLRKMNLPE